MGNVASFGYDLNGNLRTVTDARTSVTEYTLLLSATVIDATLADDVATRR